MSRGAHSKARRLPVAVTIVAVGIGALWALQAENRFSGPLQELAYKLHLTAKSPSVSEVEEQVRALQEALDRSDQTEVREVSRILAGHFDALEPAERGQVGPDVEVELLRARQFLLIEQARPSAPAP